MSRAGSPACHPCPSPCLGPGLLPDPAAWTQPSMGGRVKLNKVSYVHSLSLMLPLIGPRPACCPVPPKAPRGRWGQGRPSRDFRSQAEDLDRHGRCSLPNLSSWALFFLGLGDLRSPST